MKRALALTLLLALGPTGIADARDGRAWPQRTIRFFEVSPSKAVRDGAKLWNRSGVKVRLKPTRRRSRADVIVERRGASDPRFVCEGRATLGWPAPQIGQMLLEHCPARFTATQVATHEFGHVLGLDHDGKRCALLNVALINGAPNLCPEPAAGFYRCRILERRDVRRAVRKYGGEVRRVRPRATCPLYEPPAVLAGFDVQAAGPHALRGELVLPARPAARAEVYGAPAPQATAELARLAGPCPPDPAALFGGDVRRRSSQWDERVPFELDAVQGPQCVAARVVDGLGRASAPAAREVTPPPA